MSRTAKIVSIEPPDPISDPRVEEILIEMNVEVLSANKKAIRSIHKWSIQLYHLCCIIGGMCFIPRGKFLTKRDIRRHSIGIASKDIILLLLNSKIWSLAPKLFHGQLVWYGVDRYVTLSHIQECIKMQMMQVKRQVSWRDDNGKMVLVDTPNTHHGDNLILLMIITGMVKCLESNILTS